MSKLNVLHAVELTTIIIIIIVLEEVTETTPFHQAARTGSFHNKSPRHRHCFSVFAQRNINIFKSRWMPKYTYTHNARGG